MALVLGRDKLHVRPRALHVDIGLLGALHLLAGGIHALGDRPHLRQLTLLLHLRVLVRIDETGLHVDVDVRVGLRDADLRVRHIDRHLGLLLVQCDTRRRHVDRDLGCRLLDRNGRPRDGDTDIGGGLLDGDLCLLLLDADVDRALGDLDVRRGLLNLDVRNWLTHGHLSLDQRLLLDLYSLVDRVRGLEVLRFGLNLAVLVLVVLNLGALLAPLSLGRDAAGLLHLLMIRAQASASF